MSLHDKHLVITGGTGALGGAVVSALIDAGARCHLPAFEASAPDGFELADHPQVAVTWNIDLTDEAAVRDYYAGLPPLWGSIHIAGGFAMKPIAQTSLADLQRMVAMNGVTCFLACREAVTAMRASGGGRIVNIAARPALEPTGGMVAYAASKAMVASITQCLALEVAGDGILVNAIVPSIIDTPANRAAMPGADHARWPKPAELAEAIRFLASPANALTSGALVPVYGGQ